MHTRKDEPEAQAAEEGAAGSAAGLRCPSGPQVMSEDTETLSAPRAATEQSMGGPTDPS